MGGSSETWNSSSCLSLCRDRLRAASFKKRQVVNTVKDCLRLVVPCFVNPELLAGLYSVF